MNFQTVVLCIAGLYIVGTMIVSFLVRRAGRSSESFVTGGTAFPAVVIGVMMASEFIGTSASLGTAQGAYNSGISAAWNLVSLAVGFVLFSFFLAHKYKALGANTISAVLKTEYGEPVRIATSIIMIVALLTVGVATFASGGAVFTSLLGIDKTLATVITGVLAAGYVVMGGMQSVVYTNVLHAVIMLVGVALAAFLPLRDVGGFGALRDALPNGFFDVTGVGFSQIVAWLIAGAGATFATQYIIQAIAAVPDERRARWSSVYSSLVLIPYGVLAAIAGMCARVLFPDIDSLEALPSVVIDMNAVTAGIVIAGLLAAMLGTASAIILAVTTLLLKDFFTPYFNKENSERKNLAFIRVGTVVVGLLPIVLALYASDVLSVTFLGKALRSTLAVLVILMFYVPRFGSRAGALISIIGSLVGTVGWFLAGDPFGIDNAYIAIAVPVVVMVIADVVRRTTGRGGVALGAAARSGAGDSVRATHT